MLGRDALPKDSPEDLVANVKWQIENTQGAPVGESEVDENRIMKVPHGTDPSKEKRAGDMVPGDCFLSGSRLVYVITSIVA